MPDKVYESILNSLQRQIDRNWTLRWDPKTVAEEIKAALHEVSPAEFRSAVQQPGPMFVQYGQPGLIGEVASRKDAWAEVTKALEKIRDIAAAPPADLSPGEMASFEKAIDAVASYFR